MYEQRYNPYNANVGIIKGYFKSGVVLALGIMYIITAVLDIISAVSEENNTLAYLLASSLGSSYSTYSTFKTITVVYTLFLSCFTILTAVGFIVAFATSRSSSENTGPGGGISILHVLSVIYFVLSIIAVSLIGILVFLAIIGVAQIGFSTSSYRGTISTYAIIAIIVIISFCILLIFYTASMKNFYRSAKHSLRSTELYNNGAGAYGVLTIIFTVFAVIGFIMTLASSSLYSSLLGSYSYYYRYQSTSALSIISSVLGIVKMIFTAILALGYKSYINRQKYSYNNTPYGGGSNGGYGGGYQDYNQNGYQGYNYPGNNSYNDNYSDSYNAKQATSSYCPACGAQTDPGSPFCPNCGTRL